MPVIHEDIEVEINIYCSCGNQLTSRASGNDITVENCDDCLNRAIDEFKDEIEESTDRYEKGFKDGWNKCFEEYKTKEV